VLIRPEEWSLSVQNGSWFISLRGCPFAPLQWNEPGRQLERVTVPLLASSTNPLAAFTTGHFLLKG